VTLRKSAPYRNGLTYLLTFSLNAPTFESLYLESSWCAGTSSYDTGHVSYIRSQCRRNENAFVDGLSSIERQSCCLTHLLTVSRKYY